MSLWLRKYGKFRFCNDTRGCLLKTMKATALYVPICLPHSTQATKWQTLLAMIALSTVQSRTPTEITMLFIGTSNNAQYRLLHSLISSPYLALIASNDKEKSYCDDFCSICYY